MSNKEIKAVTLLRKGEIEIGTPPSDFSLNLGPNDVKIAPKSVGICGSDVHYWTEGRIGDFVVHKPMVLGHESSGLVVEVGANVKDLKVGDRVAMEPGVPCRSCQFCKTGRYNLCPDVQFFATPPIHGSLASFVVHPADFCFKLPDEISYDEGALLEPLSVGVHACSRAGVKMGDRVLITGAGPIGLVCLLVAKASGCSFVQMIDLNQSRLKMAQSMGADGISTGLEEKEKYAYDVSIECSGAAPAVTSCLNGTRSGGTVVIVGMSGKPEISIPLIQTAAREVDIRGVFRYANCYPKALELLKTGKVDAKKLVTHRYALEEAVKAFTTAKDMTDGKVDAIKVILTLEE